jgi:hypothetical protein
MTGRRTARIVISIERLMDIYSLYVINLIYLEEDPFSDMIRQERGSLKERIDKSKGQIRIWNKQKLRGININQSLRTALPRDEAGCYNKTNFTLLNINKMETYIFPIFTNGFSYTF